MAVKKKSSKEKLDEFIPFEIEASETRTRRNEASDIVRTDRYTNILNGLSPFRFNSYEPGNSYLDVREAVILCQLAYWNMAVFKNVIDLMSEFSAGELHFRGGSKKACDFFSAFFKKININNFQDMFYREYFRSGNVFIHRFDSKLQKNDITKIIQTFGSEQEQEEVFANLDTDLTKDGGGMYDILKTDLKTNQVGKMEISKGMLPVRYIILNPADVRILGTSNFSCGVYFKILSDFELTRLRNPMTEEDELVYQSLPKDAQAQIKVGSRTVIIPLDPHKISMVFYKKQDYEPFAVPMGFPVLEDINAKAEMKQIDMAIARTAQQAILLITHGVEQKDGSIWFNQKNTERLQNLMANRSVSRTLVADFTTKGEWLIPEISNLLTSAKYEQIDKDINVGLNNVFMGGEKFANQQQRVELFIARLECARKAFLENFLYPEIKRLCRNLGFRSFPIPYYEDIALKDHTQIQKIYERLVEVGVLTPQQGLDAIDKNILPDPSTMVEEYQEYKALRDKGLYQPLVGGPAKPGGGGMASNGRPGGSSTPQTTKTLTPIGQSRASVEDEPEKYSMLLIKENLILASELANEIEKEYKKKNKIKKLSDIDKNYIEGITNTIIANEVPKDWVSKIPEYYDSPIDKNKDRLNEIYQICGTYDLDVTMGAILLASKKVKEESCVEE